MLASPDGSQREPTVLHFPIVDCQPAVNGLESTNWFRFSVTFPNSFKHTEFTYCSLYCTYESNHCESGDTLFNSIQVFGVT